MKHIAIITLLLGLVNLSMAQKNYQPSSQNLEAREWFQQARFGLFIHWGIYSLLGDGEWVMNNQNIQVHNYQKLAGFFNPIGFDADEWVKMAKNAGMKYITITSRHHDGFSMFKTNASDYNIVDATPYKKDVLKDLAEACRKHEIKLFFYYSLLDWGRADYHPVGRTGLGIKDRAGKGRWEDYIKFMKAQLTELLTNYGEIGGVWLDGHWDQVDWDGKNFGKLNVDWHYEELYALIHRLQPQALIGNNHHLAPFKGEDFQMFERDLPGKNTMGWGTKAENVGTLPYEMCQTINGSWGFDLQDDKHKTGKELVRLLVSAAGFNSNLLLNVGPMPNGKIQKEHIASLKEVGAWINVNGETIYGTTAGPIKPTDSLISTQKGKTVYLHLFDHEGSELLIPNVDVKIKRANLFKDNSKLKFKQGKKSLRIFVADHKKDTINTIIKLSIK